MSRTAHRAEPRLVEPQALVRDQPRAVATGAPPPTDTAAVDEAGHGRGTLAGTAGASVPPVADRNRGAGAVVLNTRPQDQAAELSRLLREAGFAVVELPVLEIVPAWDPAELEQVAARLQSGAYTWIVLTSQNAARTLLGAVGTAALPTERVICGAATAAALGLDGAITLPRFSAAAALDTLRPRLRADARMLVPRAAEGREELLDGLHTLGVAVDAPVCYRTQAVPPDRLAHTRVDVITLCSPSALHALLDAWPRAALEQAAIVCLGETTARAVRSAGLTVRAVAAQTSMPSLVEAVCQAVEVAV
jgi:uroporphyrinogen-III synthase